MARKLALVVVLIAAALAAFHFLSGDAAIDRAARAGDAASGSASPSDDLAPVAVDVDAGAVRQAVADGSAAIEVEGAAETPEQSLAGSASAPTARIRGIVLRHDRTPCEGARVTMLGGPRTQESVERYGAPRSWKQIEAVTESDGSFALEFEPPPHYRFMVSVSAPMAPDLSLRDIVVEGNDVHDVGTLVMGLGGRVELRIICPDGSAAPGRWSAWTRDVWNSPLRSSPGMGHNATSSGVDNVLVFAGLAPGTCEIEVKSAVDAWETKSAVRVVAGETVQHDLVYDGGAALDQRLVVQPYTRKFDGFGPPAPEHAHLVDAGGNAVPVQAEVVDRALVWNGLLPGEYTLVIDDPRFRPVADVAVATGALKGIELFPSVTVVCRATTAVDGEPVAGLRVKLVEFSGVSLAEDRSRELGASTVERPTEAEVLTTPDAQSLSFEAPGFMPKRVEFASGFEPRSTENVDVVLEAARMIRGRVVRANGAPVVGCKVTARAVNEEPPPAGDREAESAWRRANQQLERHDSWTDAEGRFALGHLVGDMFDVCTLHDPRVCAFAVAVAAPTDDLVLVLEPHGRLEGRITPVFDGLEEVRLSIESPPPLERLPRRFAGLSGASARVALEPDGTFAVDALPAGAHALKLRMPGARIVMADGASSSGGTDVDPAAFTIGEGATTDLVVDVAAFLPRVARVRVIDTGRTGTALQIEGSIWDPALDRWIQSAAGVVGPDEIAHVRPLCTGRWRFALRSTEATWTHQLPGVFEVVDSTELAPEFEVELVRGRVAFEDASGVRLANQDFFFEIESSARSVMSDSGGEVELCMPAGTYSMGSDFDIDQKSQKFVLVGRFEVVWTATGPRDPVVVVPDEK